MSGAKASMRSRTSSVVGRSHRLSQTWINPTSWPRVLSTPDIAAIPWLIPGGQSILG